MERKARHKLYARIYAASARKLLLFLLAFFWRLDAANKTLLNKNKSISCAGIRFCQDSGRQLNDQKRREINRGDPKRRQRMDNFNHLILFVNKGDVDGKTHKKSVHRITGPDH